MGHRNASLGGFNIVHVAVKNVDMFRFLGRRVQFYGSILSDPKNLLFSSQIS